MSTPNWMKKLHQLLVLLGQAVGLVGQILSLYSKFRR
jgi:hypothetical protein